MTKHLRKSHSIDELQNSKNEFLHPCCHDIVHSPTQNECVPKGILLSYEIPEHTQVWFLLDCKLLWKFLEDQIIVVLLDLVITKV